MAARTRPLWAQQVVVLTLHRHNSTALSTLYACTEQCSYVDILYSDISTYTISVQYSPFHNTVRTA